MLPRAALLAAALSAMLLAGCASRPLAENVDPKGRSLVLVLDGSASMADNDPGRARVLGATLAAALAGAHDNVGVIAYNARAKVLAPLSPAGSAASRELLRAAIEEVGTTGSTDFGAALDAAEAMLEEGHAPRGSSIVFLTDGLPTGHVNRLREFGRKAKANLSVPEAVGRIAAKGWRIFAITFGPEAPQTREYLAQLTGPTGGSVAEAKDAGGLLDAFQGVSVQAFGYLSANRLAASDAVTLAPGTRRLAFLGRFEGAGDLGALAHDGKAADEAGVVRFPRNAPFAAALVEDPATGRWQIESGGATAGLTLLVAFDDEQSGLFGHARQAPPDSSSTAPRAGRFKQVFLIHPN
ncbi:MAG: VWA domain-containing protein, partial [Planctomycetota bacterium]